MRNTGKGNGTCGRRYCRRRPSRRCSTGKGIDAYSRQLNRLRKQPSRRSPVARPDNDPPLSSGQRRHPARQRGRRPTGNGSHAKATVYHTWAEFRLLHCDKRPSLTTEDPISAFNCANRQFVTVESHIKDAHRRPSIYRKRLLAHSTPVWYWFGLFPKNKTPIGIGLHQPSQQTAISIRKIRRSQLPKTTGYFYSSRKPIPIGNSLTARVPNQYQTRSGVRSTSHLRPIRPSQ